MAPRDPAIVSKTMSHIRGKDTGIEMKLRKALSQQGVKYRLYSKKIYGHPDISIEKLRIAIFCDSEFWHGYHFEENQAKLKTHLDYWIPKIKRNIARDEEVNAKLKEDGYLVLRYWGFEIEKELDRVVSEIMEAIRRRQRLLSYRKNLAAQTTLVYIEQGDSYLLLHRVKKSHDPNEGKWIGVGGHVEKGESIYACMKREVKEETGLTVKKYAYLGAIDFLNTAFPMERMYLFKVTEFEGDLKECDEGELRFVGKSELDSLPMWEGDRIFLPFLEKPRAHPFRLSLFYEDQRLIDSYGPF